MSDNHFLGQGSYGCIYNINIPCATSRNNKKQNKQNLITKIHKDPNKITQEIEISKKITKQIPHYDQHISPVLETCSIGLAQIDNEDADKCDFINESNKDNTFLATKLKSIEGTDLDYYFQLTHKKHNANTIINKFIYFYKYLSIGIEKLTQIGIIHYDMKDSNVIINTKDRPIIIDFGLSFDIHALLNIKDDADFIKECDKIFFFYPFELDKKADSYEPWCPEIAIISFIVVELMNTDNKDTINTNTLKQISDWYIDGFDLETAYFTSDEIAAYKEKKRQLINSSNPIELIKHIIKETYTKWDAFALSIMFLKNIYRIQPTCDNPYIETIKRILSA